MCGIGTGKSQSPGNPHRDSSFLSSFFFSASTLLGILEPSNTALLAIAARPKKFRRDTSAMSLEAGEMIFILVLLDLRTIRFLGLASAEVFDAALRQTRSLAQRGIPFLALNIQLVDSIATDLRGA